MKSITFVSLLFVIGLNTVQSQIKNKDLYELLKKSPTQATLYATACPGLGHLYANSNYGGWYTVTAAGFYSGAVLFNNKTLRKTALFCAVLTHIISIVDAGAAAERYNSRLTRKLLISADLKKPVIGLQAIW